MNRTNVMIAGVLLVTMGIAGCVEQSSPNAAFETSQDSANTGEEIEFDASASTDPEEKEMSFHWDFGDGNTGQGELARHSYEEEGEYVVTLTLTTDDGREDQAEDTLEIRDTIF